MKAILLLLIASSFLIVGSCSSQTNQSPTVKILAPTDGQKFSEQAVKFQGQWSDPDGNVEKIEWSFGDGGTSAEAAPEHSYQKSGAYLVSLAVTDNKKQTSYAEVHIKISAGPKAEATVHLLTSKETVPLKFISGDFPLLVELDASRSQSSETSIKSYHWDLGDGQTSDQPKLIYKYTIPGDYEVMLTVTDSAGLADRDSVSVRVNEPENSSFSVNGLKYYLENKNQLNSAEQGLKSLLYRYIIDPSSRPAEGRFTKEQVRDILMDAVKRAAAAPKVGRATIWLFSEAKSNFMAPSDFGHYLGLANWELPADPLKTPILYNEKYFDGTALAVYGYQIDQQTLDANDSECRVCGQFHIAKAEVFLESDKLCKKTAITTLTEALRSIALSDGYLVDVYGKDQTKALGAMIAIKSMKFEDLPTAKLKIQSETWELETEALQLKIKLNLTEIPDC